MTSNNLPMIPSNHRQPSPDRPTVQSEILFPDTRHTFADFFCGCCGLSLGMIQAGMKCVAAMDFSADAVSAYWTNLCVKGWSHLWIDPDNKAGADTLRKRLGNGDTANWLFSHEIPDNWLQSDKPMPCLNLFLYSILDLEPEDWLDIMGLRPGDITVFAGGPPCQGFSTANTQRSVFDQRNQLPLRYIHYARVCRPDYVLIENVPGLITLGKAKDRETGPFVDWISQAFDDAGYDMTFHVHNVADYGVPQSRRRVIFCATRKGADIPPLQLPDGEYGNTPGKKPYQTVREAIGHLPPIQAGESWSRDKVRPYGYDHAEGYVICPECLQYNREERPSCIHCGHLLDHPIRGGVVVVPGVGTLANTTRPIDNGLLSAPPTAHTL